MAPPEKSVIADVQSSEDSRQLPINKVGIKDIRHPFKVLDKSGGPNSVVIPRIEFLFL